MKDTPILFSPPMVRAILEDRKSQTRRIIKTTPEVHAAAISAEPETYGWWKLRGENNTWISVKCPYGGASGDWLWIREPWRARKEFDGLKPSEIGKRVGKDVLYLADNVLANLSGCRDEFVPGRYRNARFMPLWASRLSLAITEVRVQRLQDISEADAIAEGLVGWKDPIDENRTKYGISIGDVWERDPRLTYKRLWESIHGEGSWAANPWLWVISFQKA